MKTRNQKLETKNEKLELTNENKQFKIINIIKEEPKEIKSPNWFDKNKFKEFNYKNKIGEFKYIDIKNLVNNIKKTQLVKQMLNTFKYIKQNKKCRNKI